MTENLPASAAGVACERCGRAIARNADRWYAVKGAERGYDPLTCEASENGRHYPSDDTPEVAEPTMPEALARIETLTTERDRAREECGHEKAMRKSISDRMGHFVRLHIKCKELHGGV